MLRSYRFNKLFIHDYFFNFRNVFLFARNCPTTNNCQGNVNCVFHFIVFKITANGLALGEEAEFEAPMFNLVQLYNKIPYAQLPLLPSFLVNSC